MFIHILLLSSFKSPVATTMLYCVNYQVSSYMYVCLLDKYDKTNLKNKCFHKLMTIRNMKRKRPLQSLLGYYGMMTT